MKFQFSITFLHLLLLSVLTTTPVQSSWQENPEQEDLEEEMTYGMDISLPIQRSHVSFNYPGLDQPIDGMPIQPLGNRQEFYNQHLNACRNHYKSKGKSLECDRFEYHRQIMNQRQPQSMVNLTEIGFKKIRAPNQLIALIDEFWSKNSDTMNDKVEEWQDGNSYVNHWDNPTHLVSVDDTGLRGSGVELKRHIWSASSAVLEEWTKQELQPCSLYGIRVYHEGAIMMPHVDRLPLVASAIINVAQDVKEPWPWEVYDHDGMAHNVTLEPGDMLLFESHSVIHGHPFPLVGKYSANIYIHFEPTGHALAKNESGYFYRKDDSHHRFRSQKKNSHTLDQEYRKEIQSGHGGPTSAATDHQKGSYSGSLLPPYIQEASPEEQNWLMEHPKGWTPVSFEDLQWHHFGIETCSPFVDYTPTATGNFTIRCACGCEIRTN